MPMWHSRARQQNGLGPILLRHSIEKHQETVQYSQSVSHVFAEIGVPILTRLTCKFYKYYCVYSCTTAERIFALAMLQKLYIKTRVLHMWAYT